MKLLMLTAVVLGSMFVLGAAHRDASPDTAVEAAQVNAQVNAQVDAQLHRVLLRLLDQERQEHARIAQAP